MRTPLIAGNWKMNKTVSEATTLVDDLLAAMNDSSDREVVICPPFTALYPLHERLQGTPIALGAQDLFYEESGAYTGATSPLMLRDVGCSYVIVGHSERREVFGEDDATVNKKLRAALGHGLRVIMCVGESKAQRDADEADAVVTGQVRAGLADVSGDQMGDVVIAYEPIWAIGTGDTCATDDAQAMHAAIRKTVAELFSTEVAEGLRIQYGGSVKPANVDELMAQQDIDGALVGGASLDAASFARIVQFQ